MRTFAIIPAAGRSQRMGQPKLLLPWRNSTIIEHVLAAWRASQVSHMLMVVHPADRQLAEIRGTLCGGGRAAVAEGRGVELDAEESCARAACSHRDGHPIL